MDVLSQWLIQNEELLYKELEAKVNSDKSDASSWALKSYRILDESTLLGVLTQKITKGNEAIGVTFKYDKNVIPHATIYLTAFFNKAYTEAIDHLFTDVSSLKWFTIEKYGQGCDKGIIHFEKGKVNLNHIRCKLINDRPPYNLHFVVKSSKPRFIEEIQETLFKAILGEYLYLKQVNKITYEVSPHVETTLLTIKEVKEKMST